MPEVDLNSVSKLRRSGDLAQARLECGRLLAGNPDNPAIMRQLAIIATDEGKTAEAERLLLRIAELDPGLQPVTDLARFYESRRDFIQAISWYGRATELAPENAELHLHLAQALMIVGKVQRALASFQSCLELSPNQPHALLGQGHCMRMSGDRDACIDAYRLCLRYPETHDEAAWSLASFSGFEFSEPEVVELLVRCTPGCSAHLNFAVGRVLELQEDFSGAWLNYRLGNDKQKKGQNHNHEQACRRLEQVLRTYTKEVVEREAVEIDSSTRPIFVVGMPRSGSTLVEQILASHPLVEGTTELPYLNDLANSLLVSPVPISRVSRDRLAGIAKQYLEKVRFHRTGNEPFFIDKLPENFAHVGFISLALPRAVVIDVCRDPIDTCVANYRQFFPAGKGYSCDLGHLVDHYRHYRRLMDHWDRVLRGRVLTINYEDLVADTEAEVRRLLNHCGLEWHDGCLKFNENPRTVVTASSEQVRHPVYSESVGYWRHFAEELGSLVEAFEQT